MDTLLIVLFCLFGVAILVLAVAFICFRMAFYVKRVPPSDEFSLPDGDIYLPYRELMFSWMKEARALEAEDMYIESFDGLTLHAKYYQCDPNGIVEIMFHGYRGTAERDLCGGVQRCFKLGHNALIVDQRASGQSQGDVITFGVNESRDCLKWVDYAVSRFGKEVRLILCGISMGASTVLSAAGKELPENVIGVLADCGFSSAEDIIKKVIKQMKLPAGLLYPFVRLGAGVFGGFDLEEDPPERVLKNCKVPVMLVHGDADDYVPCQMSKVNYDACGSSKKELVLFEGAGHGLSYIIDSEKYLSVMREFFGS